MSMMRHDPTMRWIVGGRRLWGSGIAEPNGPLRERWLTAEKNLSAAADQCRLAGGRF
jgi:hypothetical protein